MTGRRLAFLMPFVAGLAAAVLAAPRRYEIDGISMGPGLLPGDVLRTGWFPGLPVARPAGRFERWIVRLPDGSQGVKRVVGLPGERVEITGGDLRIDGRVVLKSPRILAGLGSPVAVDTDFRSGLIGSRVALPRRLIRDTAAFEPAETTRPLLAVHDSGLAAVVRVARPDGSQTVIHARAGPLRVRWRVTASGRIAVVIGRLDGRAVAAAWHVPADGGGIRVGRSCLPAGAPEAWAVAEPWPKADDADHAAAVELAVEAAGGQPGQSGPRAAIEECSCWRDALYRPAADAVTRWHLDGDEVFLLGDFPSGSRDSRQFGPLARAALDRPVAGWTAAP